MRIIITFDEETKQVSFAVDKANPVLAAKLLMSGAQRMIDEALNVAPKEPEKLIIPGSGVVVPKLKK